MSKYRWYWYPNVVRILRYYPMLAARKAAAQAQHPSGFDGMPRSREARRTTEELALRGLSAREEQELEAVTRAIEDIGRQKDGRDVLRIVELVDFTGRYTIAGAAQKLYMHRNTAAARRKRFIRAVAENLGYL